MTTKTADVLDERFVRDFVERWTVAWESHDANRVLRLLTDDIVMEDPSVPETLHGREAVREFIIMFFRAFPDAHWELLGEPYLSLDGTRAAVRWRFTATMLGTIDPPGFEPTGGRIEIDGVDFYNEFREGLLSHYTVLFDMLGAGRQFGAAPKPGTLAERMGVIMQRLAARRMRRRER